MAEELDHAMTSDFTTTANADLADYVRIIRRHWFLIFAVTVLTVGLAVGYTKLSAKHYDSVAKVQIPQATGPTNRDQTIADLQTEVQVMKSDDVAARAAAILKDGRTVTQLLSHLQVKTPTEALVLSITYDGKTPEKARDGARAFADAYVGYKTAQARRNISQQVGGLQPAITALSSQLALAQAQLNGVKPDSDLARSLNVTIGRLTTNLAQSQAQQDTLRSQNVDGGQVLSPATLPTKTAGTGLLTNIAIGLLGGVVLGLILTFTRDRFDEQVRGVEDLQQVLSVPNLGSIPVLPTRHRKGEAPLVTLHAPEGPHADAFRRLRSAVLLMMRANGAKVVAVTSANAGDGKSTVAANLAVTLAQAGHSVCLVSADVRRPTLDRYFLVPGHTGLMDVLDGSLTLDEALVEVGGLSLLTSGRPHAAPTDLLQSVAMENTMATLRATFDYTVVDTPPVLAVADVLSMAGMLDAVMFVVSAAETTEADISAAESELRQVGANLTGAIMNRSMVSTSRYKSYYRQSAPRRGRAARKAARNAARQALPPQPPPAQPAVRQRP
ncbi:MAG: polysaccharide biosynthesis tyrosine autokinase [Actinomycetota bacterium]|nr:polysaccharide biosynthesis tyrosine autokinase [Actinomycetota bacterium]